ncbi:MAG: hypothetical protein MI806_29095 [Minwuiales bacterium]|nr:hypothetical protein [Minwuiales bacterium]
MPLQTLDIDLIISRALDFIRPEEEFSEQEKIDASNLIRAAAWGSCQRYDEGPHPSEIKTLLKGFQGGYGCWLEAVERALLKSLDSLEPRLDEHAQGTIIGSFNMAKCFLFDIEGHNARFERIP